MKLTYTVAEAAEILGVSERTVYRQYREGVLPRLPLAGTTLRFPAKVVDALANGEAVEQAK